MKKKETKNQKKTPLRFDRDIILVLDDSAFLGRARGGESDALTTCGGDTMTQQGNLE